MNKLKQRRHKYFVTFTFMKNGQVGAGSNDITTIGPINLQHTRDIGDLLSKKFGLEKVTLTSIYLLSIGGRKP